VKAAEETKSEPEKPALTQDEKNEKAVRWALIWAAVSIIFLAGTKLILGARFCYFFALVFALIGLWMAWKTTEMNKKAVAAIAVTAVAAVVSGYNIVGIWTREFIIDTAYHAIVNTVQRDYRKFEKNVDRDMKDVQIWLQNGAEDLKASSNSDQSKEDVKKIEEALKEDAKDSKKSSGKSEDKISKDAHKLKNEIDSELKR
ncbi:MAG: hypothetical protein HUJ54_11350, partial [Erysipelotrichaceae bacterium]|nr:hypothetical protein [Erysipelotrichaceae bacterium]